MIGAYEGDIVGRNGEAWIGQDVSVKKRVRIEPHGVEVVRLVAKPGSFPFEMEEGAEYRLEESIRSRGAQVGLHPQDFATDYAVESYFNAQDHNNFEFPFAISNLSNAPIAIPQGTDIMRFYIPPSKFFENGQLKELVNERVIQIDGREDREWKYVYKTKKEKDEDIVGIALKVKDENRKYIPPSDQVIVIDGKEKNYRRIVDSFLVPVSQRQNPTTPALWIGETPALDLGNSVTAEIERGAYPGFRGNSLLESTGEHINSRLIDPATGWSVRVEIFSPTEGKHVADWVIFKFFHQG